MGIKRLHLQSAATQKQSYSSFCLKDLDDSGVLLLLSLVLHAYFQRSRLVRRADSNDFSFYTTESVACIAVGFPHSYCGY